MADGTIQEVEVPYEIPESWEWVRLTSVLDVRDGTHTTPKYVEKGVPLLTSKNLVNGKIVKEPSKLISIKDSIEINKRSKVDKNDILLAMIGTVGNPVLVPELDYDFSVKNVAILKYNSDLNMNFTYYFIYYHSIELKKISSGAVQSFVSLRTLRQILFPLPPLAEQKRIVEQIEKALAKVDEYAKSYKRLKELDKEFPDKMKKSILQYAMQGKLVDQDPNDEPVEVLLEKIRTEKQRLFEEGKLKKKDLEETIITQGDDNSYYREVPESWIITSLKNVSKITSGGTPKTSILDYYNGSIDWITPSDLGKHQDRIYFQTSDKRITELGLKHSSAQIISANSIVYSSRAPIGHINIVKKEYATNQGCKSITLYNGGIDFFYYLLKHKTSEIVKNASGTTFLEISATKLGETTFYLPPLAEQYRISAKISQVFSKINHLV